MQQTDQPPLYKEILASEEQVNTEIKKLASTLIEEFKGKNPLFVCLLRGGISFASRLMFEIAAQDPYFHPELDYMTVSRYGDELSGSTAKIVMDLSHKTQIAGRPVIVVDDMVDQGETYLFTKRHLENKGAQEVSLAVLVQRVVKEREFDAEYHCLSVDSDAWLTGMGLDDARLGRDANRWTPWVAIANAPEQS